MTKDQFLVSAEGQAYQNLFIATLRYIVAQRNEALQYAAERIAADFAADRQFLEKQRFQDQKRFQAAPGNPTDKFKIRGG